MMTDTSHDLGRLHSTHISSFNSTDGTKAQDDCTRQWSTANTAT